MFEIQLQKKLHAATGNILLDINLQIKQSTFVSLYGKSGVGKTTFLKILAGLVQAENCKIEVDNSAWFNSQNKIIIAPQKRNIGFVFQDYALFPNMNVYENLAFVLPQKTDNKRIEEILEIMDLSELSKRNPTTLSGGQQQRVALARALVREPKLLLLDEPLSALDHETRFKLQEEIVKIHKYFNLTTILISHDPSEIYRLSDIVLEMSEGKIIRQGTPSQIFQSKEISGKVQLIAEIIEITKNDIVFIVKLISGNNILKVIVTEDEASELSIGNKVFITSKAFNPVLIKVN